jgi:hypothetical protein
MNQEQFSQKSIFLKKEELNKIITNDAYYKTFSKLDLKVRKIKDAEDYSSRIVLDTVNMTKHEKSRIEDSISLIEKKGIILQNIKIPGFDLNKFLEIPWKIGMTRGEFYENGMSHTRGEVIIFSRDILKGYSEKKLFLTLVHEKTHIYQRMYTKDVQKYLHAREFSILGRRRDDKMRNVRANPDIDEYIYKDSKGTELTARYIDNPILITDIEFSQKKLSQKSEHPYEFMALEIEKIFL